ncbi:KR-domain-containing protein [Nemania sp. FL0916]|nr:KR-domain-containing protein [Nemania sp. FL0916]
MNNNLMHISRFVPDWEMNDLFRRRLRWQEPIREERLADVEPVRLAIGRVGVSNSIHFQQLVEPLTSVPPGFIDVAMKSVSLNAKDVHVLNGRTDTHNGTTALEFSGIVTAVGTPAGDLEVGDRVVVLAPNHFTTTERVPAWAAHKLLANEDYGAMATLPVSYATALFALRNHAHLQAGESVLIHGGSGALGAAAITIAKRMGATVYATASSVAKRDYISNVLGVPAAHIYASRDDSFVAAVMAATQGRGVDVVLNSLVGDLMHASWRCVARFGRFVEVGKRELVDAGRLDMAVFSRNVAFSAFDLSELFYSDRQEHRDILVGLVKEILQLYRSGQIHVGPITSFDMSHIDQAYRYFSTKDRIGKVVVSLEDAHARIPVAPPKYLTIFDPEKAYLLVGCLGGLGRSLSRWMLARGARFFVFLARSGADKADAQQLLSQLNSAGTTTVVIRGDISSFDDVSAAVAACAPRQIGGVVHAAMGLHEGLFSAMTSEAWHTAVRPKVAGAWNLHRAIEAAGQDTAALDFFLLTSSVSGSVGTATESNYCAANAFLDSFAHWRRGRGKTAVSVGLGMISEVGYLHENPTIEALLLRRGIQPLTEEEFLQVVDLALSPAPGRGRTRLDKPAHILTGLEPFSTRDLLSRGFDVRHGAMQDPRASLIATAFEQTRSRDNNNDNHKRGAVAGSKGDGAIMVAAWAKGLPTKATSTLTATECDAKSLQDAVLGVTRRQFSNLILVGPDQIDAGRPLADFGVDSMIASEFRMWFWSALEVDVPFLDILGSYKSLRTLSEAVAAKLNSIIL